LTYFKFDESYFWSKVNSTTCDAINLHSTNYSDAIRLSLFVTAPNVTYNGSLLSGSDADQNSDRVWTGMDPTAFRIIREVEFQVRVGPFATDLQKCKLTCVSGQWIGPLCKSTSGM